MLNGMTVHLRLYQNGYVRFDGMLDVAVQIRKQNGRCCWTFWKIKQLLRGFSS